MATDIFDPRAYVQSLLPRGTASPQALAAIEPQLQSRGISLQRSSGGDVRGRIYLPNPGGYQYGNAVDLVGQWGQPWTWTQRNESAPSKSAPMVGQARPGVSFSMPINGAMPLPGSPEFEWLTPQTAVDPTRFSLARMLGGR